MDHEKRDHDMIAYESLAIAIRDHLIAEASDGDAIILCGDVVDVEKLCKLIEYQIPWLKRRNEEKYISFEALNESCIITQDEEFFNSQPNWITFRLRYF